MTKQLLVHDKAKNRTREKGKAEVTRLLTRNLLAADNADALGYSLQLTALQVVDCTCGKGFRKRQRHRRT